MGLAIGVGLGASRFGAGTAVLGVGAGILATVALLTETFFRLSALPLGGLLAVADVALLVVRRIHFGPKPGT